MNGSASRTALVALVAVAAGVGLVLLSLIGYRAAFAGRTGEPQLPVLYDAPTFELTDQLDRRVSSTQFRGKVVVANFIYTNCTDICPLLSAHMQALQARLREEGLLGEVQLLSFTVDPVRDTPAVLRTYAQRYNADSDVWRFLTGPKDEQEALIVQGFHLGVVVPKEATPHPEEHQNGGPEAQPYEVMHSGRFALIDREWRIRAYYDGSEFDLERVVRDVRGLR